MSKLAVIAGNGNFPFLFLEELKSKNQDALIIALLGETDENIDKLGYQVFWTNIGKLDTMIDVMHKNDIKEAIMCGQVIHTKLFTEVKLDFRAIKLLGSLVNKKTDSILGMVAIEFEKEGIKLISSLTYMSKWLPQKKDLLTNFSNKINEKIMSDIKFGFLTAKKIASLDIGQTVVVKDNAVVAVEGLEGTDKCILRGHDLAGEGVVVAKVNKPNQDIRFDVPVIGIKTFEVLKKVKANAICYEAGKTLFFNMDESLKIANENKIFVFGL
ncbi:MAG: UDP-2,3-diacylglucosamine diphosphatase LpxI [Elusimicrobiota bacterium]|nr:UDP-2,3-diacylglucosamine diphosphatase LpxI [Elusimicrobiota bacterium]